MKKGPRKPPNSPTPLEIAIAARGSTYALARKGSARLLGRVIHHVRRQSGLSQTEFGRLVGAGQRRVSNWELGKSLAAIQTGIKLVEFLEQQRKERIR